MNKCTFAVHEIELVVNAREHFGDGSGVGDHAASAHDLGQVTAWHNGRRLIVYPYAGVIGSHLLADS